MLPPAAVQLPVGLLLLAACYAVLRRALGASVQALDLLLGLILAWISTEVTSLLTVWSGLQAAPSPLGTTQAVALGLLMVIPYVSLNALAMRGRLPCRLDSAWRSPTCCSFF